MAVEGTFHLLHDRKAAEQSGEILELRVLVVDRKNRQSRHGHTGTAGSRRVGSPWSWGTVITVVVPWPVCDSIRSA